ncbi:MAG: hypothetical protein U1C55_02690 [Smithellaceae bacterium]|nr:hypothetical protein [Smithellaceae bacterium]
MECPNHPGQEVWGQCQKYQTGYCRECCHTLEKVCPCFDPKSHCKYRTSCVIWALHRMGGERPLQE